MHIRDLYFVKATDLPSDEHSFGEWATTKKATCTENGEKTRTCSACGKTEIESIPALGHNYVNLVCSECGKTASCEDGHSYQIDLFNNPARFENRWGVCEFCGYIDELHEHILQNGKCKYCDEFELHEVQFKSVFDFDKDGQKDVFTMANTLPEKFRADGAIHMSASKENLSTICVTYDEVRAGWENPMPYVHHFVNEQDKENSYLLYKITVEEAGIYELGIHIRLKDARYRGATFFVNGKKALEFSYGWNLKDISLTEEQMSLRSNDLLKGSYIYGITIELEKGENEIRITSPEECSHSMHFRDFYFVKKQTTPPVEHNWTKTVTPPTATANGVITYTCSCGDSYTETIVPTDFTITQENRAMIGFTGAANENLVIPAVFENNGTWYRVTCIGENAFIGEYELTSVVIPESVTAIGINAFQYCITLGNITIPSSVTAIGTGAFSGLLASTSITVEKENPNYQSINGNLYTKDGTVLMAYAIGKPDISFVIPDSVTVIDDIAFSHCITLTSVTIPKSVTAIGDGAFMGCYQLMSVEIPDGVTNIGEDTFYGCWSLTSVIIPDSVTTIGDRAFDSCEALTHVYYGGTEAEWMIISFGKHDGTLKNATLYYYSETKPTTEGNYWHYVNGVPTVWEVYIEDGLAYELSADETYYIVVGIGSYTSNELIIPAEYRGLPVKKIANNAFCRNNTITRLVICEGITEIGISAFNSCDNLEYISIPKTVSNLGLYSFYYCHKLKEIYYNATNVQDYNSQEYPFCGSYPDLVTIGPDVERLSAHLFLDCHATEVRFEEIGSLVTIENHAFSSGFDYIYIPARVETIRGGAFAHSGSGFMPIVNGIYVDVNNPNYKSIDGNLYSKDGTVLVRYTCRNPEELFIVPEDVVTIGEFAFKCCYNLKNIVIGSKVARIEKEAFNDSRILNNIFYYGTAAAWNNIYIESGYYGDSILTNLTHYYYSETKPTTEGNYWHWVDGVPTAW